MAQLWLPRHDGSERPAVIGMVHLRPLPGSPSYDAKSGFDQGVLEPALRDADALAQAGVDAVMVENFGDQPFFKDAVPAETVAAMAVAARAVGERVEVPLGVNVLRNDACSALAVAAACGASMIRVNILAGAAWTDQGLIEGQAARVLRLRRQLGLEGQVRILADVRVKHARPTAERPLAEEVDELTGRGGADAVIVTGWGSGQPINPDELQSVRKASGATPVFVGSGVTPQSIASLPADGYIVGSSLKTSSSITDPICPHQTRALMQAIATPLQATSP